jgi:hypothetical protein
MGLEIINKLKDMSEENPDWKTESQKNGKSI